LSLRQKEDAEMKTTIETTAGGYSVLIDGIFRGWRKTRKAAERLAAALHN
jgi:hypothetical protein